MKMKIIFFTALALVILILSGYFYFMYVQNNAPKVEDEPLKQEKSDNYGPLPPVKEGDPIKERISNMNIDEKIGQMLILGIEGYTMDDHCRKMIDTYHAGGFIILAQNVQSTDQLLSLVNSLKGANSQNSIPLFMSVDQEGGRVDRMPEGFARFPANSIIGHANDKTVSFDIGSAMAEEIKAFGFNVDFAPVLDINSNPRNPVIGDRSFGSNPEIVSALGIQTMKGIQSGNIISVVKHFPGHGDTSVDSHLNLPTVNNDLNRLASFELIPFSEAAKNGADGVMIAHILLPAIDHDNPASFSKEIVTGILRNQMKFNGVVITDDMTMGAIVKNYNIGDAAVKAINAGCDILLVCHGYDYQEAVFNAVKSAVGDGTISKERVDESVYRILSLKDKYKLNDNTAESVDVNNINQRIYSVVNRLQ